MLIVLVEAIAQTPAEALRLQAEARKIVPLTRAEEGCLDYAFSEDILDSSIVRVAERWRDQRSMEAHLASPHMASFFAFLKGVSLKSLKAKVYDGAGERDLFAAPVAS